MMVIDSDSYIVLGELEMEDDLQKLKDYLKNDRIWPVPTEDDKVQKL